MALKVLGTRKLASFLSGDRYYLRVEPAYPENTTVEAAKCLEARVQCWVFQGEEDADLAGNLIPQTSEPARLMHQQCRSEPAPMYTPRLKRSGRGSSVPTGTGHLLCCPNQHRRIGSLLTVLISYGESSMWRETLSQARFL